ncbi:MAG: aminotransferase class I/II-fold pyridoxal phosphate-dependent enzyme, partial [Moraxellaceae bacterium]
MRSTEEFIKAKLAERQAAGIYRTLKPESGLADFCSNDYLGFARSAVLKSKIDEELAKYPDSLNGSAGSRLLAGNLAYTENLEAEIATYHESEAGLLFNSGYDANVGLFSSLPQRGDTIILDELAHASIIDGARLSNANRYSFKHNDMNSLEDKLKAAKGNIYVGIESVYSMDGDTPPMAAILELTQKYNAALVISYMGFESLRIEDPYKFGKPFKVMLREDAIMLNEVVISKGGPFTRKQMLRAFRKNFLGERGGSRCKIENEQD